MSDSRNRSALPHQPARTSHGRDSEPAREMHPEEVFLRLQAQTRRHFLRGLGAGVGSMFLGVLIAQEGGSVKAAERNTDGSPRLDFRRDPSRPLAPLPPEFHARAKRVIYLHMAGAPSQLELFDYKPDLNK